jgi:hypothetical protein
MDAEFWTLPSGQRVYRAPGLSRDDLSRVPTEALRPSHFAASPLDVPDMLSLSKSAVQRAMTERQWVLLLAERAARKGPPNAAPVLAPLAAPTPPAPAPSSSRKRVRATAAGDAPLIVIDAAFEGAMTPTECCSLGTQLVHAYAAVRRAATVARFAVVGCTDARAEQLRRISGAAAWRAHISRAPLERALAAWTSSADDTSADAHADLGCEPSPFRGPPPPAVVYLTADATDILWRTEAGAVYVVGGFVDRNRAKGLTAEKAARLGIRTARFPLQECDTGRDPGKARRRVLTTNRSVELLVAVRRAQLDADAAADGGAAGACASAWEQAIRAVLGQS